MTAKKKQVRAPSNCCGPVKDRIDLIKQVAVGLRDGHHGVAGLYEKIAEDVPKAEQQQFRDKAAEHRRMGDASLQVLVPDDLAPDSGELDPGGTNPVRSHP